MSIPSAVVLPQEGVGESAGGTEYLHRLIVAGAVNGEVVRATAFKILPEHEVEYDGDALQLQVEPRYFMLNKPLGYVRPTDDPGHPLLYRRVDRVEAARRRTSRDSPSASWCMVR